MFAQAIKTRLEELGYSVSPNYGLIMEKGNPEYAIADIRESEGLVVLPWWNRQRTKEAKHLNEVLLANNISFRDGMRASD